MSMLVDTGLGQFRCVQDGERKRFLFECPDCHEMLPLEEDHMNGSAPVDHESRIHCARFCTFSGTREFGKHLVTSMQALILMGYRPWHDEGEDRFASGRGEL